MTLRNRLTRIYGGRTRSSSLRQRLEGIAQRRSATQTSASIATYLGGEWRDESSSRVFHVRRSYPLFHRHGIRSLDGFEGLNGDTIGLLADDSSFQDFDPQRVLFFDTETTGLSGGAGTYVFLVGLGYFRDGNFHLHQLFLPDYGSESLFLNHLAQVVEGAGGPSFQQLVSFNGKSYDLNLLANRVVLKRLSNPFSGLPHLDLIHPCRLLWKGRFESCSLQTLERNLLGFVRRGDIPSHLIPQTYFSYLRSGAFRPFREVFEHNRHDILSMVVLLSMAAAVVEDPVRHRFADPLSAARLHQLRGRLQDANSILAEAVRRSPNSPRNLDWVRELALLRKRLGRNDESLSLWRDYLRRHPRPLLEAFEEPAKILEHRRKDLEKALLTVRRGLRIYPDDPSLLHRRHRLECKIEGRRWWGRDSAG